ncbi:Myb-like protein A [Choanephora cucurbitarum]|uniref:Myb-like protein A n=1 Tax=Choanephora cucurbitarum TaxID=101091 RepID=A0A1C7N7I2_9FUNG|nr:Myb-like protein A [Choanephora cucurbitarum]
MAEKWQPWEDELLSNYVKHNGKKWTEFVQHCLPHRSSKQCEARWSDMLDPRLKQGPFSIQEKQKLREAVGKLGEGRWAEISREYLPERSPRRIANVWSSLSSASEEIANKHKRWTPEEDQLLLQGIDKYGYSAWTKIASEFLPWRSRMQIRNHYLVKLDPNVSKEKWTDDELDLLLRRTIIFGQKWNKVAEGIPKRSPEQCSRIWMTQLDPGLNKEPWTSEETLLFWKQLVECKGNFVEVSEKLPGRTRMMCFEKFWSTVKKDPEFCLVGGDRIEQKKQENAPEWRTRIASLVCEWLEHDMSIREASNGALYVHYPGKWSQDELDKLKKVVDQEKSGLGELDSEAWKRIALHFDGRNAEQSKYQYQAHAVNNDKKKGTWSEEEDSLLEKLIKEHGTSNWDRIIRAIPHRSQRQCAYRWYHYLQYKNREGEETQIVRHKRLTETEKLLIQEGVDMFGTDWHAIHMVYLPTRTPKQMASWWYAHTQKQQAYSEDISKNRKWTEEEDKVLNFAVQSNIDTTTGQVPSWAKVAKMIQGRTSSQCRVRWMYSLRPGLLKGIWSYDEELRLVDIVQKYRFEAIHINWATVAGELGTGRSEWACRCKYNYMQKKGNRFAL